MRNVGIAITLATIALVAGCGQPKLTSDERLAVSEARLNFAQLVLDGRGYGKSLKSVDTLIAIYREKPDAEYDGMTMDDVLRDAASDLDEYRPDMAAELDRAVRP